MVTRSSSGVANRSAAIARRWICGGAVLLGASACGHPSSGNVPPPGPRKGYPNAGAPSASAPLPQPAPASPAPAPPPPPPVAAAAAPAPLPPSPATPPASQQPAPRPLQPAIPQSRYDPPMPLAQTPAPPGALRFSVRGVDRNDVLNVRADPGPKSPVIGEIPPEATGVVATGGRRHVGPSIWREVTYGNVRGWVNERFLVEEREGEPAADPTRSR